jgi:hypothetical protein
MKRGYPFSIASDFRRDRYTSKTPLQQHLRAIATSPTGLRSYCQANAGSSRQNVPCCGMEGKFTLANQHGCSGVWSALAEADPSPSPQRCYFGGLGEAGGPNKGLHER